MTHLEVQEKIRDAYRALDALVVAVSLSLNPPVLDPSPLPTAVKEFLSIKEFLIEHKLSYSTYRKLRLLGMAPSETRLTKRTIRISRSAIEEWRMRHETASHR